MGIRVDTKTCGKCLETKPLDEFHRNKNMKDGRVSRCKDCAKEASTQWRLENRDPEAQREYMRRWHDMNRGRRYGLTPLEYLRLEEASGGVCAVCGQPPSGKRDRLVVDHDHVTNKVRGMVCHPCNSGIGLFQDDPERLRAAAQWVQTHREA